MVWVTINATRQAIVLGPPFGKEYRRLQVKGDRSQVSNKEVLNFFGGTKKTSDWMVWAGGCFPLRLIQDIDVSENSGFSPQIIPFVHRVFHYFHHPFWGPTPIFGNTHINSEKPHVWTPQVSIDACLEPKRNDLWRLWWWPATLSWTLLSSSKCTASAGSSAWTWRFPLEIEGRAEIRTRIFARIISDWWIDAGIELNNFEEWLKEKKIIMIYKKYIFFKWI